MNRFTGEWCADGCCTHTRAVVKQERFAVQTFIPSSPPRRNGLCSIPIFLFQEKSSYTPSFLLFRLTCLRAPNEASKVCKIKPTPFDRQEKIKFRFVLIIVCLWKFRRSLYEIYSFCWIFIINVVYFNCILHCFQKLSHTSRPKTCIIVKKAAETYDRRNEITVCFKGRTPARINFLVFKE